MYAVLSVISEYCDLCSSDVGTRSDEKSSILYFSLPKVGKTIHCEKRPGRILRKSLPLHNNEIYESQLSRLKGGGYRYAVLRNVVEMLLKKKKI